MPRVLGLLLLVLGTLGSVILISLMLSEYAEERRARALRDHPSQVEGRFIDHDAVTVNDNGIVYRERVAVYEFEVGGQRYTGRHPMAARPEKGPVTVTYLAADPTVNTLDRHAYFRRHEARVGKFWSSLIVLLICVGIGAWLRFRPPQQAPDVSTRRRRAARVAVDRGSDSGSLWAAR